MVAVLSSNNRFSRDNRAPAPALHADGSNFEWRMFFDNGQRIVDADTLPELLDYLIDGYSFRSSEEQKAARLDLARSVQALARMTIVGNLTPEESEKLADWEWALLQYGEGLDTDPFGWGDGSGVVGTVDLDGVDYWESSVPLVLLETSYAPFTEITSPLSGEGDFEEVSNIIWLRPQDEFEFLRSLSRIGFITFGKPSTVAALEIVRKN